jgi:putative transposase
MRDELLNESLFLDLDHARSRIANWIDDYNQRRPHSALGYLTPDSLCRQSLCHVRSAAQPRPAPPIARCSTRVARRKTRRDSNRRWMKLQW